MTRPESDTAMNVYPFPFTTEPAMVYKLAAFATSEGIMNCVTIMHIVAIDNKILLTRGV
jgi:hypothetical protein